MDTLKGFFIRNWTLAEKILLITDVLLAGVILGMIISPLKNGIMLFSGNEIGSNNDSFYEEEEE